MHEDDWLDAAYEERYELPDEHNPELADPDYYYDDDDDDYDDYDDDDDDDEEGEEGEEEDRGVGAPDLTHTADH